MRSDEVVARLGGDEFAIVIPRLRSEEQLVDLSNSIIDRLREPMVYKGQILDCRVSIGVCIYPIHGSTGEDLLKSADVALDASKSSGRATTTLFRTELHEDIQRANAMVLKAHSAIQDDRIVPYYQPKIDLRSGAVVGFEALLRWRDAQGRIQTPSAIASAFDDLDMAAAISDRMAARTIADMRHWLNRGIKFEHVAINASAAEFRRDDFAERLLERLEKADIATRHFQLEVTETVFLGRGADYVHRALALLSSSGVKIALDDFGTGYASLRHLKEFPVDTIKIDKSFVRDMEADREDEEIIRAVLNLGGNLGIRVVAEGIETRKQVPRRTGL
jgi:predicted signal transduction protein with EAL and GGDEF domain